jgi:hypothetical protein
VREYEAKVAERTTRYLGALENAAASAEEKELPAARELFERESVRLKGAIKPAVQRVTKRTSVAGGDGGGPFQEVVENDGLLTGLVLHTGDFAGHAVLVAVQPIFSIAGAARLGTMRGVPSGAAVKLEAADGYAIGGLNLQSGDRVDGLEIVFMKIKPGGLALDPADSYTSKWVGGKGGGPVKISGRGNVIVGIYGATGLEFDSLGLIELVQSNTPGASVKEVIRENPATIAVTSLTAETLAESPAREAGKWQHVPEALRGAKIFSTGPKQLGVAEYKVSGPGRVYVACNYDYQGNPSGKWTEDRWMPEDFKKNGWALVEGIELRSWEGRTFQIFTRELKAGESGRLRCNKYEPPYFISFNP